MTNRIFGLDLLRSLAILFVVLEHSTFRHIKAVASIQLPDGVDLFFVLSGYLIGTILIKTAEENRRFDWRVVLDFLQRRWFRTLPNYFLFLVLNIVLVNFGLIKGFLNKYLMTYFVFFQNFHQPFDFLFWESWSLSVEEWFYLAFPLAMLFLFTLTRHNRKPGFIFLVTLAVFLLSPLAYRIVQFHSNPLLDFDLYFRKLVLTRLDTIGFGLAGAYINHYHGRFWQKSKTVLFVAGVALTVVLVSTDYPNDFFTKTFYLSAVGLSGLFLLPMLTQLRREKIPFRPFEFVSRRSYSMYLIHLPLYQIITTAFPAENTKGELLIHLAFWLVLICLSHVVYRYYEKPLMNLRESDRTRAFVHRIASTFIPSK